MKRVTIPMLVLSAFAVGGCSEHSQTALEPDQALFAKPGGSTTEETDPMTVWAWEANFTDTNSAVQTSRIRGDGAGDYVGGKCGVHAKIFWTSGNSGGDAVFDPDYNRPGKGCTARFLNFDLQGGTVKDGPFTNVYRIMDTYVDKPRSQHMRFTNSKIANCERIHYGKPTASETDPVWATETPGVRVTRTAGEYRTRGGGKWIVETEPPHEAQCYVWSGGDYVPSGDPFVLPFRVQITELPSTGSADPAAS